MPAESNHTQASRIDSALLLLRAAALFLFITSGLDKAEGLLSAINAGKPLATAGLAPLIGKLGLPFPAFCALYVVVNESLGALLITVGLFTRVAAFLAALSMAGAFYTAAHLGWEPFRAFLYILIFVALAAAGAGKFSLDSQLIKFQPVASSVDVGLLVLRAGLLLFFVLLFTLKKANAAASFPRGPATILLVAAAVFAIPVILGFFARQAAVIACLLWSWGAASALLAGQKWDIIPYRDAMVVLLFLVLAIAGPGAFNLATPKPRA